MNKLLTYCKENYKKLEKYLLIVVALFILLSPILQRSIVMLFVEIFFAAFSFGGMYLVLWVQMKNPFAPVVMRKICVMFFLVMFAVIIPVQLIAALFLPEAAAMLAASPAAVLAALRINKKYL